MARGTQFQKGSILLIPFPFTDLSKKKIRPCVVLASERDDVTVVFLTSVKPKGNAWLHILPSEENGIKQPSYVRYTKVATLDINLSLGEIGILENKNYKELISAITRFLKE